MAEHARFTQHPFPHRELSSPGTIFRAYGLNLLSNYRFTTFVDPGEGPPDLTFRCTPTAEPENARPGRILYTSVADDQGKPYIYLYHAKNAHILRFTDVADYQIGDDQIACDLRSPGHENTVDIHLFGLVFSIWHERRGIPALHASAVTVGDQAVAFLAGRGSGKSSLAGTLVQHGAELLTDDILPVTPVADKVIARPGFPQMRFWPAELDYFVGDHERFPLAHPAFSKRRVPVGAGGFGRFCDRPAQLRAIYLPDPRDCDSIQVEMVHPRQALLEMIRHSFASHLAAAMKLRERRFHTLGDVARRVPVFRLTYPSGFENLPRARDRVLRDLS